jgi:hypothetical protein
LQTSLVDIAQVVLDDADREEEEAANATADANASFVSNTSSFILRSRPIIRTAM